MAEKPILDVLRLEGFSQQRVVLQVDHSKAEVIASPPVGMDFAKLITAERFSRNSRPGHAVRAQVLLLLPPAAP
jgi:hypothetical protein